MNSERNSFNPLAGPVRAGFVATILLLIAAGAVLLGVRNRLINPVNYTVESVVAPWLGTTTLVPAFVLAVVAGLGVSHLLSGTPGTKGREGMVRATRYRWREAAAEVVPAAFAAATALAWSARSTGGFWGWCAAVALLVSSMGKFRAVARRSPLLERLAPWALGAMIVAATVWHALQQTHFWQHFLLGYADFGFFTTELEHCLPWKDVGENRFADTRLGYHAVWMFYLLVPFHAVFRSPLFLMVVGPLALNIAAAAFYGLARERSGSRLAGLVVGVAWLALPSVTRLPYSNTYGFQSAYLAVPWLAFAIMLGVRGKWSASHACLAAAVLCEETVCGVAFGWGAILTLFSPRRRDGLVIMAGSVLYLLVMAGWVIPAFAAEGVYTRLHLFGDTSSQELVKRLFRDRVPLFLLALVVPLLPGLLRGWRLLPAALPTLLLVLLLQQRDYLNIKYWHQTTILPVLFAAAAVGVTRFPARRGVAINEANGDSADWGHVADGDGRRGGSAPRGGVWAQPNCFAPPPDCVSLAKPLALLVSVALFHFVMGSSPAAQAERIYSADPRLQQRDARLDAVELIRREFSPERFTVVATERMAAHFTDYRMVWPAGRMKLGREFDQGNVIVIDRSDRWDRVVLEDQADEFITVAGQSGYRVVAQVGPVVVLAN